MAWLENCSICSAARTLAAPAAIPTHRADCQLTAAVGILYRCQRDWIPGLWNGRSVHRILRWATRRRRTRARRRRGIQNRREQGFWWLGWPVCAGEGRGRGRGRVEEREKDEGNDGRRRTAGVERQKNCLRRGGGRRGGREGGGGRGGRRTRSRTRRRRTMRTTTKPFWVADLPSMNAPFV